MNKKENISFLQIGEVSLPRAVYDVLLSEILKFEKGEEQRDFVVEDFSCRLYIYPEICRSLGSCASGILCDVFVMKGKEYLTTGRFLASVRESKPPKPGSLKVPLY